MRAREKHRRKREGGDSGREEMEERGRWGEERKNDIGRELEREVTVHIRRREKSMTCVKQ